MEFEMTAVFHYGKDSQKHIHRFQKKHFDYVARELQNYSANELRSLLDMLNTDNGTLVCSADVPYNICKQNISKGGASPP